MVDSINPIWLGFYFPTKISCPLRATKKGEIVIMQETNFYPIYKVKHSFDILTISLLMTLALIYSFRRLRTSPVSIVGLVVLLLFVLWFSRTYIRRIVFTSSYFLVERYISPARKINYSDVIDMGRSTIKTRGGKISFAAMSNLPQLHAIFFELMREGKIDIDQFENKAIDEEIILDKSFWPSMIISLALNCLFLVYWFYHQSHFNLPGILIVLILIGIFVPSIVQWFYKKRW